MFNDTLSSPQRATPHPFIALALSDEQPVERWPARACILFILAASTALWWLLVAAASGLLPFLA